MDSIMNEWNEYLLKINRMYTYIDFLDKDKNGKYKEFQDIIYTGIINRSYSIWESFVKNLFYVIFEMNKDNFIKDESIVSRYKLHEMPGYIMKDAIFDSSSNSIVLNLNKELVTFTSKNLSFSELNQLFVKIDYKDLVSILDNDMELKDFSLGLEYEKEKVTDKATPTNVMKRIINERNIVAHTTKIEGYQSFQTLCDWLKFYQMAGSIILTHIYLSETKKQIKNLKLFGELQDISYEYIICIDTFENVFLDNKTEIFVFNSADNLVDIVKPISFYTDSKEVESVKGELKVGIKVKSILPKSKKMKSNYKYMIIESED